MYNVHCMISTCTCAVFNHDISCLHNSPSLLDSSMLRLTTGGAEPGSDLLLMNVHWRAISMCSVKIHTY